MMPSADYEYALVRIVPSMEGGEQINAGLLMAGIDEEFLVFTRRPDLDRFAAFWPKVDWAMAGRHLTRIASICAGPWPDEGVPLSWRARFQWLTAARSALIQCSDVHGAATDRPLAQEMERLSARYFS